jgi:hypothetical protein
MMDANRQIKLLLILLVIGVWGLLLRSLVWPVSGTTAVEKRVYVSTQDEKGKIRFDHTGTVTGTTLTGLVNVLDEAARQGVKVHSITPLSRGGYVVFVEK